MVHPGSGHCNPAQDDVNIEYGRKVHRKGKRAGGMGGGGGDRRRNWDTLQIRDAR